MSLKISLSDLNLSLQNKGSKFGEPTSVHYLCIEQGGQKSAQPYMPNEKCTAHTIPQRSGTPPTCTAAWHRPSDRLTCPVLVRKAV